ncbi:MAG: hypothetical protein QNJ53_31320 [Pleurocapsa sp. MO_192.B19]|nr:hypothetical protein [Pleurocapsa sp. MO_192.B19]
MKNIFSLLSILSCTLGYCAVPCFPALADQCSYITKEQASTAISRLNLNQTIYKLCEPCGEKNPQPTMIENLSMETVDGKDFWQVKVNAQGIDLAYVFIDSGIDGNFINLAAVANCTATRVSPVLSQQELGL